MSNKDTLRAIENLKKKSKIPYKTKAKGSYKEETPSPKKDTALSGGTAKREDSSSSSRNTVRAIENLKKKSRVKRTAIPTVARPATVGKPSKTEAPAQKTYTLEDINRELSALQTEFDTKTKKYTDDYWNSRISEEFKKSDRERQLRIDEAKALASERGEDYYLTASQSIPQIETETNTKAHQIVSDEMKAWDAERKELRKKIMDLTSMQKVYEGMSVLSAPDYEEYSAKGAEITPSRFLPDMMTEQEKGAYQYIVAKDGKDKAEEFLDGLDIVIETRKGQRTARRIDNIEIPVAEQLATAGYKLYAGAANNIQGMAENFSDKPHRTTSREIASSQISENLADEGFKIGDKTSAQYLAGAAETVGGMLPSIAVSYLTKGLGTAAGLSAGTAAKVGQVAGAATVGLSAGGSAYAQALAEGYDQGQARTYSIAVGASEAALTYALTGIGKLGGVNTTAAMARAKAIKNVPMRMLATGTLKLSGEITEEELQLFLEPAFRSIIFNEEYDAPTAAEMAETAILTAMATLTLESGDIVRTGSKKYSALGQGIISEGSEAVTDTITDGLLQPKDSGAYAVAQKLDKERQKGKEVSPHQLGVLAETILEENANKPATLEEAAEGLVNDRESEEKGANPSVPYWAGKLPTLTEVPAETANNKPRNVIGEVNDNTRSILGEGNRSVGIANGQAFVTNSKDLNPSPNNLSVFLPVNNVEVAKTELGATESVKVSENIARLLNDEFTPISKEPVEGNFRNIGTVRVFTDEKGREIALPKDVAEYFEGFNLGATYRGGKPYAIKATDNDGNVAGVAMAVWNDKSGTPYNLTDVKPAAQNAPSVADTKKLTGYGDAGTSAFTKILDDVSIGDKVSAASEFNIAYRYGMLNANDNVIDSASYIQSVAFNAGKQDYIAEIASKKDNVKNVKSHGKNAGFDRTNVPEGVTSKELDIMDTLCKALGVRGRFVGKSDKYNANMTPNVGEIVIASDFIRTRGVGENARQVSVLEYFLEEAAAHRAKELAPEAYMAFEREMYQYLELKAGVSLADIKRKTYGDKGVDLSVADAIEEVMGESLFSLYDYDIDLFAEGLDRVLNGKNEQAKKGANVFKQALDWAIEKYKKVLAKFGKKAQEKYQPVVDEATRLRDMFESSLGKSVAKNKEIAAKRTAKSETTDAKPKLSAKLLDDWFYTEKDYKAFGWARAEGLLSAGENADYRSKFAQAKSGQATFYKTKNGEYMIPVSDIYSSDGVENTLVFAKGTIDNPVITCIIKINENNETVLSRVRGIIYGMERRGIRAETGYDVRRYYASAFTTEHYRQYVESRRYDNGNGDGRRNSEKSQNNGSRTEKVKGKFSLKDSEGNTLTKGQQEYFKDSKVRDENGNLLVAYHGTDADFTTFDADFISDDNKLGNGFYFKVGEKLQFSYDNPITAYLNITNPITDTSKKLSEEKVKSFCEKLGIEIDYAVGDADLDVYERLSYTYTGNKKTFLKEAVNILGVDGVLSKERKTAVAFDSNQIKRTDNENPTSNPDIRFSLKEPVEETKNLVALHNLSEEKLLKTLALGGFPMPSIAITKSNIPHTNFGDITLVMSKDTIDPKANKKNTVYSADAWTPVVPNIEYEVNPEAESRLRNKFYDLSRKYGREAVEVMYSYGNTLEDRLNSEGGAEGIIARLKDDTRMMNVYLLDIGKEQVENVYKEKVSRLSDADIERNDFIINGLGEDVLNETYPPDGQSPIETRKKWLEAYGEELEKVYADYLKSTGMMSESEVSDLMSNDAFKANRLIRDVVIPARNYLKNGAETRTREYDSTATNEAIKNAVDTKAYEKWLQDNFGDVEKSQGIYNNKDYYMPSGKRRSFAQTHYPVTLENIVKAMTSKNDGNTKNVSGFVGIKTLRAGTAERFKSIADMHKREDRLQHLTAEEAEAINDALSKRMNDIMSRVLAKSKYANDNPFIAMDAIGETLNEVAESGTYTIDNITKVFAKYDYNIGNTIATEIRDLLFDVTQMPVNIFEAKPERAVGFDEVLAAILPDSASDKLRTQLEKAGVNILTYESGNDADRMAKVNSVENAKFSLKGAETDISVKEVAKLKETINDLKERHAETVKTLKQEFKDQLKVSKFAMTDKKAVEKTARAIIREFESGASVSDIQNGLTDLYNYMANGDDGNVSWNELYSRAYNVASNVLKNVSLVDDTVYQDSRRMREYFRTTPIYFNPEYGSDIGGYESLNDFRKANFGRINLTKDGVAIDSLWGEMSELFPAYFDSEELLHPAEMLSRIADALDAVKPVEYNPYSYNMREATTHLANDIIERFYDLPQVQTIADKAKRKVVEARIEGGKKVAKVRAEKDAKIKQAITEGREKAKKAVLGEKMAAARDMAKMREKYEKRIAKMSESGKAKVLRAKILSHASDLSNKLLRPTDNKHIPQNLQGVVAKLLECINLESNYSYDTESHSYKKNDEGLPTRRTQAFRELQKLYVDMAAELVIDPDLMGDGGLLSDVIALSDKRIADMTSSELQTVWETMQAVEATITTANRLFSDGKFETISAVADMLRSDNAGKKKRTELRFVGGMQKLASLDMLTPETYLHMLGDAGDSIFRMMRNAQDKHIQIMKEVAGFTHKELKGVKINKLEKKLHTVKLGGEDVQLTTAQLMELYVLMRRDQAREHILVGGILPDVVNKGIKKITEVEPIRGIQPEEIGKALTLLSAEEKAIAEKLQEFVSTVLSRYGNEASMKVYNYEKFGEKNYWTIRTNKQEIKSDIGQDTAVTTVSNRGFTKGTKPHANTSVRIGSIFDTFSAHSSDMATYAAWLGTSEDVNRIRNFVFWEEGARTGTVKGILDRVHGLQGAKYLEKLLTDIAIGVKGVDDMNPFAKLTGAYKAAAVGANLRVIIQQPTAILRALDMIAPQYIALGEVRNPLKGWEKAKKYSPIAQWKDWGYFDINTGRQMKDVLFDNADVIEKAKQVGMWGASKADSTSWGLLWNAVEAETKATHKELKAGSEEFYKTVAERFTEIADHTQVVDGILQRSQIMRSRSDLVKMATSFMGEPTKQYNMAVAAAYDAMSKTGDARKKAIGRLGRTVFALGVSGVVNAMVASLVDGLRDDDKEKEYWEKWLEAFVGYGEDTSFWDSNLADVFNPLTYIPFAKDIVSIGKGYDVKRMDTEAISKTYNAAQNMYKALSGESKYTVGEASANLFAETARLFGLPVSNVKRDIKSIAMTVLVESDNYVGQYRMEKASSRLNYSGNNKTFVDILYNAYVNDREAYEIIYEDMIEGGFDAEKIETGINNRLKKAEGVKEVTDLEKRYLSPQKEKQYDSKLKTISSSDAWKSADAEARKDAKNLLYKVLEGTDKDVVEKMTEGKPFGLDDTEYVLYKLALDMADTDGNGSYSAKEKAAALDTISLGDSEIAYLWGGEQALEAWSYGVDMNGYASFKGAVSQIKRYEGESDKAYKNRKKEESIDLANEYATSEKDWLYFMGAEYSSYKKRSDYKKYFD